MSLAIVQALSTLSGCLSLSVVCTLCLSVCLCPSVGLAVFVCLVRCCPPRSCRESQRALATGASLCPVSSLCLVPLLPMRPAQGCCLCTPLRWLSPGCSSALPPGGRPLTPPPLPRCLTSCLLVARLGRSLPFLHSCPLSSVPACPTCTLHHLGGNLPEGTTESLPSSGNRQEPRGGVM